MQIGLVIPAKYLKIYLNFIYTFFNVTWVNISDD